MRDEPVKDAAQDMAEDVTQDVAEDLPGAAEDESAKVHCGTRHLSPPPALSGALMRRARAERHGAGAVVGRQVLLHGPEQRGPRGFVGHVHGRRCGALMRTVTKVASIICRGTGPG